MPQKSFVDPDAPPASILSLFVPITGAALARAQGGPPFIGDDPGTPGNHHWEINFGWIANHNPGQSYYEIPDVDMNYGWGDRIQLKYELPLAAATDPNNSTGVGLGESYPGIKWRYFEYHRAGQPKTDENLLFSLGTYPQVMINNPTSSVRRGIVQPRPAILSAHRSDGANRLARAQRRSGPMDRQQECARPVGPRLDRRTRIQRSHRALRRTLRPAGHQSHWPARPAQTALLHARSRRAPNPRPLRPSSLLFMGGRAIQAVTRTNGEPSWIAYIGLQLLLGPKEKETPVARAMSS
jgi:hypothetical protein